MRILKLWISIGEGDAEEVEIPLLDNDTTSEELDEIALEAFNDLVHFDWEVVNEGTRRADEFI